MKTECRSERFALHDKIYPCPLSVAMDLLGGKWKAVILYHLQGGPQRFTVLRRLLPGATEAVLSRRLQQLEQDGLLSRQGFGEKPPLKTEYALTDFGRSVLPALNALLQWGNHVVMERGQFVD
jgi:site-specific recombinase, phage integrase family